MRLLITILSLAVAGSAMAQDADDDWDAFVQPDSGLTMASVDFGHLGIILSCRDGGLEAALTGLPTTDAARRDIHVKFPNEEQAWHMSWIVGLDPTLAISERPARFGRELRTGGRLDVVIPGAAEGGRNLRYALDLPTSHAVLDGVLTACNKPLEDPRDAELDALGDTGLPGGINWARAPQPRYPSGPRVYERGFALISCLSEPDGSLRACEVESEHPRDGGFGDATLAATRRARLGNTANPGQPVPLRMILFQTNYSMESMADSLTRSARPGRMGRGD